MAYQTGVASSINDLFTALSNWLVGQGWSSSGPWTDTHSPARTQMGLTDPDGNVFTFCHMTNGDKKLYLNMATSYSTAFGAAEAALEAQAGANTQRSLGISYITPPFVGYHFFYDGKMVNVALEVVSNVFTHFNFGQITKNGSWSGGTLVTGLSINYPQASSTDSNNNGYPFKSITSNGYWNGSWGNQGFLKQAITSSVCGYADMSCTATDNCCVVNQASNSNQGMRLVSGASPNGYNDRAVMLPTVLTLSTNTRGNGGNMYQLGHVPNAALVNITDLDPKTIVNNEWMIFPLCQKNGSGATYHSSGVLGIAYRK